MTVPEKAAQEKIEAKKSENNFRKNCLPGWLIDNFYQILVVIVVLVVSVYIAYLNCAKWLEYFQVIGDVSTALVVGISIWLALRKPPQVAAQEKDERVYFPYLFYRLLDELLAYPNVEQHNQSYQDIAILRTGYYRICSDLFNLVSMYSAKYSNLETGLKESFLDIIKSAQGLYSLRIEKWASHQGSQHYKNVLDARNELKQKLFST